MRALSLNGTWGWRLPNGPWTVRAVPSCYPCVGEAVFERTFDLTLGSSERAFLCFEGISYTGRAVLNGHELGRMLPYARHRFEITRLVQGTGNRLTVTVADITADYGPTGGWEDYGGISRDVFIDVRDKVFIDDIQWLTTLRAGTAACTLTVWLDAGDSGAGDATVTARLSRNGATAWTASDPVRLDDAGAGHVFRFELPNPELWSPDTPALYELEVSLETGGLRDRIRRSVGIREIRARGSRFLLNGEEVFLKGVARHEMWGDQGFSLTDAQVREDLLLIKKMGANFVRLVHYPHSAGTIEAADRIGLMVSEEPGLWWSDMGDPAITGRALEIMRRTVLRDRNSPSVIAWLFFNECVLDNARDYLVRGRDLCRSLDPSRLISGANCMDSKAAKAVFDDCGFDFYTQHPYSHEPRAMEDAINVLQGKPLVFTEWGGWYIHNNPNLLEWFGGVLTRSAHARPPAPCLAGLCWWQWQDVFQFSRGLPGCQAGLLSDGLVDRDRRRKPMYAEMAKLFEAMDRRPRGRGRVVAVAARAAVAHDTAPGARMLSFDLSAVKAGDAVRRAWELGVGNARRFARTPSREGTTNTGPILPTDVVGPAGLPITLPAGAPVMLAGDCRAVDIPLGCRARALHVLGHTTYFDGFPVRGSTGEVLARYVLAYEDGTTVEVPLRNGVELASASMIARCSRMDPIAAAAARAFVIEIDPDWEVYQVNHFVLATDPGRRLERLRFEALSPEFYPLLYGIAADVD